MRPGTVALLLLGAVALVLAFAPDVWAADTTPDKDVWDILSALSGVLVATIGAVATYVYNRRQRAAQAIETARELRVTEVQTVANFLPHLQSSDAREKKAALVAMSALGNTELVGKLAKIYHDPPSIDALAQIASATDRSAAALAKSSLTEILNSAVVKIADDNGELSGTGFVANRGIVVTADYLGSIDHPIVHTTSGATHSAQVLGTDTDNGVTVLRVPDLRLVRLLLAGPDIDVRTAGPVTLLGSTGSGWQLAAGELKGELAKGEPTAAKLVARLPLEPGQGGAPVVDQSGRVVAMAYGTPQAGAGSALLIPVRGIWAALKRFRVAPDPGDSTRSGNPPESAFE